MAFELNRIDGKPLLAMLRPENVSVRADEAMIELRLSADHDIELYFPAPEGMVESRWLELAAEVFIHLTEMDNEVQRVSAEQWVGTPWPSSYFQGELAYITLTESGEVVIHYFVIRCNSEWDERFVQADGRWNRKKQAEPGTPADGGGM